jgi:hypothetical protein
MAEVAEIASRWPRVFRKHVETEIQSAGETTMKAKTVETPGHTTARPVIILAVFGVMVLCVCRAQAQDAAKASASSPAASQAQVECSPTQPPANSCANRPRRVFVWRDANVATQTFPAPAGAHVTYYGGPVISNVQVIEVFYGTGSYLPQLMPASTPPNMPSFYTDITNSSYLDMLSEYNTAGLGGGSNQRIGRGSFGGAFTITPSASNNGSIIDDAQIQNEISAQVRAGTLPAPTLDAVGLPNTVYMIHFPHGKTITMGGASSCMTGGFCAYHGTLSLSSGRLLYGVLPDMQDGSGCHTGCGSSASTFNNQTAVASHELAEAITDADVGLAIAVGPPLAWYDQNNGEIGDICNGQDTQAILNGTAYFVQTVFSNLFNACIAGGAITANATTTSLSVTLNPVLRRQFTSFAAQVIGGPTPTGTITFLDGTTVIGSSALDSTGTAHLSTFFTTLGLHNITASYSGDAGHAPSVSPVVVEEVDLRLTP